MPSADTPPAKRQKASDGSGLVVDAEEVVSFHGLAGSSKEELLAEMENGGIQFHGEFFHQHFGEEETIKGYEGLEVKVWFSLRTYHAHLDIKWAKRRPGADKVVQIFQHHFPHASATKESFLEAVVASLSAHPDVIAAGEVLASLDTKQAELGKVDFVKYHLASSGFVREVYERLDALLLFFIDGASLIDTNDSKWELLLAVQNTGDGTGSLIAGIQTMYNFWAFPSRIVTTGERTRPPTPYRDAAGVHAPAAGTAVEEDTSDVANFKRLRLSQVLVLPPYQGMGLGKQLLQLAYEQATSRRCHDLTFEDPSDNLQRMREKLEVEMLLAAPWVGGLMEGALAATVAATEKPGTHASGAAPAAAAAPAALLSRAASELKIPRREARVVWEALLLMAPNISSGSGAQQQAAVRGALEQLVRVRTEEQHFGRVDADAAKKQVHQVLAPEGMPAERAKEFTNRSFLMMRTAQTAGAGSAGSAAAEASSAAAAAPGSGNTQAPAEGMAATGRLNVVMKSMEEKQERLAQLVDDRMDQLDTLARLLKPRVERGAMAGAPGKPSSAAAGAASTKTAHLTVEAL